MNRTARNFVFTASLLAVAAAAGCTQRIPPVVSYAPQSQLSGFDAVITARGVT